MAFGPSSKEEIQQDALLVEECTDVVSTMEAVGGNTHYSILKYVFSSHHNRLFYFLADGGKLRVGKVLDKAGNPIDRDCLRTLSRRYTKDMLTDKGWVDEDLITEASRAFFNTWLELYDLLVAPVLFVKGRLCFKEVLVMFKAEIDDVPVFFNIPLLYDISYRAFRLEKNEHLYFTNISHSTICDYYVERLSLPYPTMQSLVVLNGLEKESHNKAMNPTISKQELNHFIVQEQILEQALQLCADSGGKVIAFRDVKEFDLLFSISNPRNVIQVITHFHNRELQAGPGYVRLDEVIECINNKKSKNDFNSCIILDGSTCTNFKDFAELKKAGVRYIYYSHHDIRGDLATFTLWELYSGTIAKKLGTGFPYINGSRHLNIIYADVLRNLYIQMNRKGKITLPGSAKQVRIEGENLSVILQQLESSLQETKAGGQNPHAEHKGGFNNYSTKEIDFAAPGIILTGIGSAFGQFLIDFFFRKFQNEVTIITTAHTGEQISITLKNRTEKELVDFLKKAGIYDTNEE